MKSVATKFILFSTVVVFAFSGMQSDRTIIQHPAEESDATFQEFIVKAANERVDQKDKQDDDQSFSFPNVFDALGFIF